jgi:putative FmdB family regulatory protein
MPTYGYRCTACKHEFERIQKMSDAPLTECEECQGLVKKILYPVGIAFKGSGFYVNDSKASAPKSKPAEAKTETPATETKTESAPAESKPTETKTESKTETKTETKSTGT